MRVHLFYIKRSSRLTCHLFYCRFNMPPRKAKPLVSNEGHLLRVRMRDSQETITQKHNKLHEQASRLDVMYKNPTGRHAVSAEDASRILGKIVTVRGKLNHVSQMFRDWDTADDDERRKVVWKTGQEELRKIDNEIVTIDLEMLNVEVSRR